MTTHLSRTQLFQNRAFRSVRRAGLATDLPAAGFDIFTITNSPVLVYTLFGVVTTALSADAIVCRIQYTAAVGGALTPLSGIHATMISDPVGTMYHWSGLTAGLLVDEGAVIGAITLTTTPWAGGFLTLMPGVIRITNTVPGTGIIDWYITYLPLLDAGLIVAA